MGVISVQKWASPVHNRRLACDCLEYSACGHCPDFGHASQLLILILTMND